MPDHLEVAMPMALCCMSHSPLLDITEQREELVTDVRGALRVGADFANAFDPNVVVMFVPDHYNGFFHRVMPQFCIGTQAHTIGDYDSAKGELDVPEELALELAEHVLAAGVDVAISRRMVLDHATAQPMMTMFGALDARPLIPIFINSVAQPAAPLSRSRALGAAVGAFFKDRPERALIVGSGGLSHDPPVPLLKTAPPPVAERLITGRPLLPEELERKHLGAIAEGEKLAAGTSDRRPLSPEWDNALLDVLIGGDFGVLDGWQNADISVHGAGAHEIRTWVAAYSALAAAGPYTNLTRYYRAIPEYIAGFAVTTAEPAASLVA